MSHKRKGGEEKQSPGKRQRCPREQPQEPPQIRSGLGKRFEPPSTAAPALKRCCVEEQPHSEPCYTLSVSEGERLMAEQRELGRREAWAQAEEQLRLMQQHYQRLFDEAVPYLYQAMRPINISVP